MRQERERLTGLYNKEKAMELIQDYLGSSQEECVAIVMDIDNFQKVNNLFGVERGDDVLKDTARVLQEFFMEDDIISRINGDQFIIFAKNCKDDENLNIRLHELCTTMEQEITDGTKSCRISASIGVAVTETAGRNRDVLFQAASEAIDDAKKNGKGAVNFYRAKNN